MLSERQAIKLLQQQHAETSKEVEEVAIAATSIEFAACQTSERKASKLGKSQQEQVDELWATSEE